MLRDRRIAWRVACRFLHRLSCRICTRICTFPYRHNPNPDFPFLFFFFFCSTWIDRSKQRAKTAKRCKYTRRTQEGRLMICKFLLNFGLWCYRRAQKREFFIVFFFTALFHLYSQLLSTEAGWHIETDVLHVDNWQACLEAKDEMQKRGRGSKSLNICLGSPFFFIYWNING